MLTSPNPHIAGIILAAGASTRMGSPKQLLLYKGKTLLQHAIHELRSIDPAQIVVVLGAFEERIRPTIETAPVEIVVNSKWETGMGSSLHAGMKVLVPHLDAVLLMVADQPFTNAEMLGKLVRAFRESDKPIAAAAYKGILGVPAIFDKQFFLELSSLKGQGGARKLLKKHYNAVFQLPFEKGAIDIDTPEDYRNLS